MSSPLTKLTYTIEGEEPVELPLDKISCAELTGLVNGRLYKITLSATNANGTTTQDITIRPTSVQTPTASLMLYVDALDVETTGTVVTRINDPVHEDHFTQGLGEAELISNAFGTNDAIRFTGSQTFFNTGVKTSEFTDEITMYLISSTATAQKSSIIHTIPYNNNNGINLHLPYRLSSGSDVIAFDFGDKNDGGRLLTDFNSAFDKVYLWEFKVRNNLMEIWRNDILITSQQVSSFTLFDDGEIFTLGDRLITSEDRFEGDLYFLAVYNEFHTEDGTKRTDIIEYLSERFEGIFNQVPIITNIEPKNASADVFYQYKPSKPTFTLSGGDSKLTVTVTGIDDGNLTITDYEYSINAGDWISAGTADSPFDITGLDNDETYSVKIRAINSFDTGIESDSESEAPVVFASATGGTTSDITVGSDNYRVHKFTGNGTFDITVGGEMEMLVVGGGGGGGAYRAGGGGAGGYKALTELLDAGEYAISVGAGGSGGSSSSTTDASNGANGNGSSIAGILSVDGGGQGGARAENDSCSTNQLIVDGGDGGSGGGAGGAYFGPSGCGIGTGGDSTGNGNKGANGTRSNSAGDVGTGGGGGAGAEGNSTNIDGNSNGGAGIASSITGSSVTYAGGGGGASSPSRGGNGTGGTGGGGDAGASGSDGSANTGGGGGGGYDETSTGGDGGSGIVIIRYKIA